MQRWLEGRTCVSSSWGREHIELKPTHQPRADHWQALWLWANSDPVTFKLMDAFERCTGLTLSGPPSDRRSLANVLMESLSDDLRDFILLLEVQKRPLPRAVITGAELAATPTIELALKVGFVRAIRSNLVLDEDLVQFVIDQTDAEAERDQRHDVLAAAFESHFVATTEGLSALEALRHYASTGRVAEALRFGRFGAATLIDAGRGLSRRRRFGEASRAYQAALTLHERGAPVEMHARAYARHYFHYNRYKADEETLTETRTGYETSLDDWPENALFWSRLIRAEALCGDLVAARAHQAKAIVRVLDRQASARYLYDRVVDRLRRRGYWSEAVSLCPSTNSPALALLLDGLARPRDVHHLAGVILARATPLTLTQVEDNFACAIPGFTGWGENPADAMDELIEQLPECDVPLDAFEVARKRMVDAFAAFARSTTTDAALELGPGAVLWLREAERRGEHPVIDGAAAQWRTLYPYLLPKLIDEIALEPQILKAVELLKAAGLAATRSLDEDILIVGGESVDGVTDIRLFNNPFMISRTPHRRLCVEIEKPTGPRKWEYASLDDAVAQIIECYSRLK